MPDVQQGAPRGLPPGDRGVRRLPKPVVAAVNGPAVGIGCSLALACDLVLAAESAFFGLAFVNIGLMPDGGSTLFVPAAVGKARAFQMAFLGERIPAAQALEWGLVNYVYPDESLQAEADVLVEKLANGPTRSYAGSKQALNRMLYPDIDGQLDLEAELQHALARTNDFREGVTAFVDQAGAGVHGRVTRRPSQVGGGPLAAVPGRSADTMRPPCDPPRSVPAAHAWQLQLSACFSLPCSAPRRRSPGDPRPRTEGGSPNAEKIKTLYLIAFALGILIFLLVEGILIYSLVKFRWRRDGEPPAQIRGNTRLEIGWTLGAASILVVLTVVTFIFLRGIKNPAGSKPGG